MTAAPRMSGTHPASDIENRVALTLALTNIAFAVAGWAMLARVTAAAQIFVLGRFLFVRLRRRSQNPPVGFLFVPLGLLWGLVGLLAPVFALEGPIATLARIGLQEGLLLNLIFGLGSRLVPFLTRTQRIDPTQLQADNAWPIGIVLLLLNASLVLEAYFSSWWIWALRSCVVIAAAATLFSMFKRSLQPTVMGFGIRLSIISMILGYTLIAYVPDQRLALLHIVFIGGFGLLTIMIATRVMLSHGGHPLIVEVRSKAFGLCILLATAAAVFRAQSWWTTAAVLWISAVLIWIARLWREGVRP